MVWTVTNLQVQMVTHSSFLRQASVQILRSTTKAALPSFGVLRSTLRVLTGLGCCTPLQTLSIRTVATITLALWCVAFSNDFIIMPQRIAFFLFFFNLIIDYFSKLLNLYIKRTFDPIRHNLVCKRVETVFPTVNIAFSANHPLSSSLSPLSGRVRSTTQSSES